MDIFLSLFILLIFVFISFIYSRHRIKMRIIDDKIYLLSGQVSASIHDLNLDVTSQIPPNTILMKRIISECTGFRAASPGGDYENAIAIEYAIRKSSTVNLRVLANESDKYSSYHAEQNNIIDESLWKLIYLSAICEIYIREYPTKKTRILDIETRKAISVMVRFF